MTWIPVVLLAVIGYGALVWAVALVARRAGEVSSRPLTLDEQRAQVELGESWPPPAAERQAELLVGSIEGPP